MAHSTWIINNSIEIQSAVINGNKVYRGCNGIEEMVYHTPCGEGDRHFVDVCTNASVHRYFNIDDVTWLRKEE